MLGLLEAGGRAAREAAEGGRATLRISAVTSAGDHVVPPLIRAFRDAHPELDIDLHIGNRREVFAGLLEHRADVAITGRVPDDELLGRSRDRPAPHHGRERRELGEGDGHGGRAR